MKRVAVAALFCGFAPLLEADVSFEGKNVEVVVAPDAPKATWFAAGEMTNFLSRVFACEVPVSTFLNPGRVPLILGTNGWSRAAGLRPELRARDAFAIAAVKGRIFITGCDSPWFDPASVIARGKPRPIQFGERATVFGVYRFLERFAGCRFYFPGELGEIVPRRTRISVKDGVDWEEPAFAVRSVSVGGDGAWFGHREARRYESAKLLNWLRLRLESDRKPFGHGQNGYNIIGRFKDSHPEYFRIDKEGKRDFDTRVTKKHPFYKTRQLCHTSNVWKEIEEDVLSYLRGESPTNRQVRGKSSDWGNRSPFHDNGIRKYINVMPQDAMPRCWCHGCQAVYDDTLDFANDLIWRRTVALADRVAKEGFDAHICQMAYRPYGLPPKGIDIPDNIEVQVSVGGPWSVSRSESFSNQVAHVKAWREKLGRPVSLWTYACKASWFKPPVAPCVAPRAVARFYQTVAPYIEGAFNSSSCERFAYQYLNYYVFSRIAWDVSVDVEKLLAEHHRLMFGAAAPEMAKFFDKVEEVWMGKVVIPSIIPETMLGEPKELRRGPSVAKLMGEIYTADFLGGLERILERAAASVDPASLEGRRVALMKAEIFDPIDEAARKWRRENADAKRGRGRTVEKK